MPTTTRRTWGRWLCTIPRRPLSNVRRCVRAVRRAPCAVRRAPCAVVVAQRPSTPSARRSPVPVDAQCREAAEPRTPDAAKRPRPAAKRPKRGQPPASYASPRCYPLRVADPPPDSRPGAVTSEASDLGHASRARCRLGLRVEAPAAGVASTNRGRGRHGEDAREGPRPPTTMAAAMEAAYQHPQEYLAGETGSGGRQGGSGRGRPGGIGPNPRRAALARLWRVPRVRPNTRKARPNTRPNPRPNTQPALAEHAAESAAEHAQGAAEHAAGVGPNVRRARARGTRKAYARGP